MEAINRAVKNSGIDKSDIGYVNAHGTGTGKNDNAEITAFKNFFGEDNASVSVSSTKVMTGHCLGAAGAIEAVFSIKALTTDTVLPTFPYSEEQSAALKEKVGSLDFVQNKARHKELKCVLSNNVAFGGTNAAIVFSKVPGEVSAQSAKAKKIAVTGLGIVSPLGNSKAAYLAAVAEDKKPESASVHSTIALDDYKELGIKMAFYRKLDNLGQLQTVSGMRALQDANFQVTDDNAKDIGIIVGTSEGGLGATYDFEELIAREGNSQGSAFKFPHTVYNAAGGYLSICSGIKGYGVTITTGPLSGLDSIGYSMNVIHDGQEQAMMATGTDENLPIITEFAQKLGVAAADVVEPFADNEGCVVGDGSVSIMLEEEGYAKGRGAKVYCYALGFGHGRKNVKFGKLVGSDEALDKAIADALADAGISAGEIDAVCGFANGCKRIDDIEKGALKRVFGEKLASMPLFEVKERTGEGRAGSAALAAAEAALLLSGELAGDNAYFVAADGSVASKKVDAAGLKKMLVISFAAGGSYSAVVFGK